MRIKNIFPILLVSAIVTGCGSNKTDVIVEEKSSEIVVEEPTEDTSEVDASSVETPTEINGIKITDTSKFAEFVNIVEVTNENYNQLFTVEESAEYMMHTGPDETLRRMFYLNVPGVTGARRLMDFKLNLTLASHSNTNIESAQYHEGTTDYYDFDLIEAYYNLKGSELITTIENIVCNSAEGHIVTVTIPEDGWNTDDDGKQYIALLTKDQTKLGKYYRDYSSEYYEKKGDGYELVESYDVANTYPGIATGILLTSNDIMYVDIISSELYPNLNENYPRKE